MSVQEVIVDLGRKRRAIRIMAKKELVYLTDEECALFEQGLSVLKATYGRSLKPIAMMDSLTERPEPEASCFLVKVGNLDS